MRTKNFFRTIVAAALCAVVSISANAQVTGSYIPANFVDTLGKAATFGSDLYDYVTVGSVMPYEVHKDNNINLMIASGVYSPSVFYLNVNDGTGLGLDWTSKATYQVSGDTTAMATLPHAGSVGANILVAQKNFPFTKDSTWAIKWKTKAAAGTISDRIIWTFEWPVSNTVGMNTCLGDSTSLDVKVVDKPLVDWTIDLAYAAIPANNATAWVLSSCGTGNTNVVNVNYEGFGNVNVKYDSVFHSLNGAIVHSGNNTTTLAGGSFVAAPTLQSAVKLTTWAPAVGTYGYVDYTIDYVNDQISRKSLARNAGGLYESVASAANQDPAYATTNTVAGANMPSHTFRVYSLPVPSKRPIQHLTNTGW
jgi:hypothetical protein